MSAEEFGRLPGRQCGSGAARTSVENWRTSFLSVPAEARLWGKSRLDNDGGDVAADSNGHHLHLLDFDFITDFIGFFF